MFQHTKAQPALPVAWFRFWICLTLTMGAVQCLQAQEPPRLGDLFVVNANTANYQHQGSVAVNEDGSFVVVWRSQSLYGDFYTRVQGRRFSSAGLALGDDFQVDAGTTLDGFSPEVAAAPNGDFVVVWMQEGFSIGDQTLQARQFLSDGTPVGDPFQINAPTLDDISSANLAVAPDGGFVVVWASRGSLGTDTDSFSVQARRFDAAGVPLGDQFQVNTVTTDRQVGSEIAINSAGDFLVAWTSSFVDEDESEPRAQLFRSDGSRLGQELAIGTGEVGQNRGLDVAANPDGDFTVIWGEYLASTSHPDCNSLQSRRVFSDGSLSAAPKELLELSEFCRRSPKIAHESDGDFVVVWSQYRFYNSPTGRRFNADGEPLGDRFVIGPVNLDQDGMGVGMDGADNFVVVWDANPLEPQGDDFGVYGQRFCGTDCLLFDGFESGDTSAWSTAVGQ